MAHRMSTVLVRAIHRSIARVREPASVRYTERQLYYEVCRTLYPTPGLPTPGALAVGTLGMLPALLALPRPRLALRLMLANMLVAGGLRLLRALPSTRDVPLPYADFLAAFASYRAQHGEPPGLLPPAQPLQLRPIGSEPDLLDYGLDRVLVCQSNEIAQMLLANRFHIEVKAAVTGLSDGLPPPIRAMLARTSGATVFLLHDASAAGLSLAATLRERLNIPEAVQINPVGLRPTHAQRLHLFARRRAAETPAFYTWPAYLTPSEYAWLYAGWCTEVAALPPMRLLLRLRRIITDTVPPPRRLYSMRRDRSIGFLTWPEA
jgi:hypothetical protein